METPLCGNLSHGHWRDKLVPRDTLVPLEPPFQDLRLAPSQEHALRVCSLLAIPPPPPDQKALPGGVPEDLSEDNLSTWADTVQDVAVGMIVPQPGTDQIIFPHLVELLTFLESVSRVAFCRQCTFRAPPADAWRVVPPLQLHPLRDRCGATLQIQPSAPTRAPAGRGAGSALPYGSSSMQAAPFGICLLRIPRTPWGTFCYSQPRPPAGRASHLESQLMAIRYGLTAPPEPLRLPQPTWMPPATQKPSTGSAASTSA